MSKLKKSGVKQTGIKRISHWGGGVSLLKFSGIRKALNDAKKKTWVWTEPIIFQSG